jgi:hypothetical protein
LILLQDLHVELPQRSAGIDAELLRQRPPGAIEGEQRLPLPPRAIEGQHQQAPQNLPEGMTRDQ